MSETIGARIDFTQGADDSRQAMIALANAIAGLSDKVGQLGQKQADQTAKQRENKNATDEAARAQQTAATQSVAFMQRVAGVANAIQSLTSRLGSHDSTSGLIGSIAATTSQFAALGASLGPAGVAGGAVAGFIVSITELASAHTAAAQAARAHAEAEAQLANSISSGLDTAIRTGGDLSTADPHDLAVAYQARLNLMAQQREQLESLTHESTIQALARRTGGLSDDRRDALVARLQEQIETEQREISRISDAMHGGQADSSGLGSISQGGGQVLGRFDDREGSRAVELQQERTDAEDAARERRQQREAEEAQYYQELDQAAAEARARAAEADRIAGEQYQHILDEQNKALQDQQDLLHQRMELQEKAAREEEQERQRALRSLDRYMQAQERATAEHERQTQERMQQEGGATQAIITNMTSVFSLMAQGQADAAQAGELLLAGFLQYISQRATVEALAQVAQALGSYPDMGGMALHFAAAAGWAAVAVASGVGGAALQSDAQSKAQAAQAQQSSKPAEPSGGGGNEKGGSNTYVINWNAPIVTGQTEAQLGRTMRRLVDRAEQRFPTA